VVTQKYIEPFSVEEWIINPTEACHDVSIIWKAIVLVFPLIGRWLVWKAGKGNRVRLGEDP